MLDSLAPFAGILGLIGFAGLAGLRTPVDTARSGAAIRLLGLLGLVGLAGIWIPGRGLSVPQAHWDCGTIRTLNLPCGASLDGSGWQVCRFC